MMGELVHRIFLFVMAIVFGVMLTGNNCRSNDRTKRHLIYPPNTPSRVQIISGFGIPVDLNLESLTMGYVFKASFNLPDNVTRVATVLGDPFDRVTLPISGGKRRRRRTISVDDQQDDFIKSERYTVEAVELEAGPNAENAATQSGTMRPSWYDASDGAEGNIKFIASDLQDDSLQNLDHSRFTLYKGIEKMAEVSGLPGRPCLLRSICETANVPFSYSNGILGELAHLIMTPSTTYDTLSDHTDNEYLHAEQLGKSGAPCHNIFRECTTSLLDQFSGIYDTINLIG